MGQGDKRLDEPDLRAGSVLSNHRLRIRAKCRLLRARDTHTSRSLTPAFGWWCCCYSLATEWEYRDTTLPGGHSSP